MGETRNVKRETGNEVGTSRRDYREWEGFEKRPVYAPTKGWGGFGGDISFFLDSMG
jgi:hypothetical protein